MMLPAPALISQSTSAIERLSKDLALQRFLKIIMGASLTDATLVGWLVRVYGQYPQVSCVDIAADPRVLRAVDEACYTLTSLGCSPPVVMMSLDVDGDPHFRKVRVDELACIDCGACVPTCPSQALTMHPQTGTLELTEPLCYGCSRCVSDCPTEALAMQAQRQAPSLLIDMLQHPRVQALELHSHHASLPELEQCFHTLAASVNVWCGKAVSLCFRPLQLEGTEALVQYIQGFEALCQHYQVALPLLQLDGVPMGGSEVHTQSLPAIHAAQSVWKAFAHHAQPLTLSVTLSGGINQHTPQLLQEQRLAGQVAGVGIGTIARQWVRGAVNDADASEKAARLLQRFTRFYT